MNKPVEFTTSVIAETDTTIKYQNHTVLKGANPACSVYPPKEQFMCTLTLVK